MYEDDAIDRFVQQVKDGDLRSAAHERAFRAKHRLEDGQALPPWVERRVPDSTKDYEPQGRK